MNDPKKEGLLSTSEPGSPAEMAPDPREARLRALYAQARPGLQPSEALRERVAEICGGVENAGDAGARPTEAPWSWGAAKRVPRWGWAVAAVALLSLVPMTSRRHEGAVEAAIRASASAPAMHMVTEGKREHLELWRVVGLGLRFHGQSPWDEVVQVDDMTRLYAYRPRKQRVEISPSALARGITNRATESGGGMLEEMVGWFGSKGIAIEDVVRDGRKVKLLSGPNRATQVTIDPETDRILLIETFAPQPDGTTDVFRYRFDYPNPASMDRRLFRFEIPKGVTVVDKTAQG